MPEEISTPIDGLVKELTEIEGSTLKLFKLCLLKNLYKRRGGKKVKISTLGPNTQQKIESLAINKQYQEWSSRARDFLIKCSQEVGDFDRICQVTTSYILLQRVGTNLTEKVWRSLFSREFTSLIELQKSLILNAGRIFREKVGFIRELVLSPTGIDERFVRTLALIETLQQAKVDLSNFLSEFFSKTWEFRILKVLLEKGPMTKGQICLELFPNKKDTHYKLSRPGPLLHTFKFLLDRGVLVADKRRYDLAEKYKPIARLLIR